MEFVIFTSRAIIVLQKGSPHFRCLWYATRYLKKDFYLKKADIKTLLFLTDDDTY